MIVPLIDDPVIVEAYCMHDGMLPSKMASVVCYPQKKVEMPQLTVSRKEGRLGSSGVRGLVGHGPPTHPPTGTHRHPPTVTHPSILSHRPAQVVPNLDEDELRILAICGTPGANISYTLDGTAPLSEDSADYVRPVMLHVDEIGDNPDATIRAQATMPGMLPSDVAEMSILDFDKCAMAVQSRPCRAVSCRAGPSLC